MDWLRRSKARTRRRREFRPTLDSQMPTLEPRILMRRGVLLPPVTHVPNFIAHIQTMFGGQAVRVTDVDREQYDIVVLGGGTVRAYAMPGARVGLIVDGTTPDSELSINPVPFPRRMGTAHMFSLGMTRRDGVINIGEINVTSGQIGQILGYRTAVLSGPIIVGGPTRVERIALTELRPGAAIGVAGDLNTFDVLKGIQLDGGPGIYVGRDLNLMTVNGDITLTNGANFLVVRDFGLTPQPQRDSSQGGVGGTVRGNLNIAPGSLFSVGRRLASPLIVQGQVHGASNIFIEEGGGNFISLGGFTP